MGGFDDINKLRVLYGLKEVYRHNSVGKRRESTAEHIFSSLFLADFLLHRYDLGVNTLRVLELVLYHDAVELYAGDTVLHPGVNREGKEEREREAASRLERELPEGFAGRYRIAYEEFELQRTREAKLAKAIEQLDSEIHELDYKRDWKDWTEEFLRKSKERYFREFPDLSELFEENVAYLRSNGYFDVK